MLSGAFVPMLFRRVEGAEPARAFAARVLGWPEVGEGMYDAGNALVGFGVQAAEMGPGVCSRESLRPVSTGLNPACELRVAAADFDGAVRRVAGALGVPWNSLSAYVRHDREGCSLSFHDATGNLTTLLRPLRRPHPARPDGPLPAADVPALVEVALQVADLARSLRFYCQVLGIPALEVTPRQARLDAGPLVLALVAEEKPGTVAGLRRRGALRDSVIFRVAGLQAEVDALAARGVEFPLGVEECRAARSKAFFFDPDGHRLVLWEPPRAAAPGTPAAGYLPVLERIEARHAAHPPFTPALEAR